MAKVEKSKQIITPFGGINFVNGEIKNSKILETIDNKPGERPPQAKYSYSDIILNLWEVFFCGGDCAEDLNEHLYDYLQTTPGAKQLIPIQYCAY